MDTNLKEEDKQNEVQKEKEIGKNFKLLRKLDNGAYGEVYEAINLESNRQVAVKIEQANTKVPLLMYEAKLYQYLHQEKKLTGAESLWAQKEKKPDKGIPQVYYCSSEGDYNVMVMEMLGPNLEDLFNICNRIFPLKTVCQIAVQLITRLEFLHNKFYVHRDIKPQNFCIGVGSKSKVIYMLDIGFAKRYLQRDGKHIPFQENKILTGTVRFTSYNSHKGCEQSRRDDLMSLGYVIIYFLKGVLPWQHLKGFNKKDKMEKVLEKKKNFLEFCKGVPEEIQKYLEKVEKLQFDEKPNYDYLRGLFDEIMRQNNYEYDNVFEWNLKAQKIEQINQ